jgi:hypothetical protein
MYQEYESININNAPTEECTYTLGIQTKWQLKMMIKHGHRKLVSFYVT